MKCKIKKVLVAASFVTLLSGVGFGSNVFADSQIAKIESKEVIEQKEKLKDKVNMGKYDPVKKSELGVKERYDPENPEPDWAPGDASGQPTGTNNISYS